jgi:erythrin-vacuolar iron transport family protein
VDAHLLVEETYMSPVMDFAELDLRSAFDFAIMIEEDAQVRYEQLSRLLGQDAGGAGDVFRMMVVNEGKHRSQLISRRATLFNEEPPRIEVSVMDAGVERPEVDDDELPGTAREALEVALAAEHRAYEFYRDAIPHMTDAGVRAFFQDLMQEEVEHEDLLRAKIAGLDERPPRGGRPVQSAGAARAAPAVQYPDRALLQAEIPRFDAATQAVAASVIVEGMELRAVARALGVSIRAVRLKLVRFLEIARQHLAIGLAAAALTGCGGGMAMTDASARGYQHELQQPPHAAEQQEASPQRAPDARGGERAADRADRGGNDGAQPDADEAVPLVTSTSTDLEYSEGLTEPPQQKVVPSAAAWAPAPDADSGPHPAIDDVWPNKGPVSGGDKVVIRGKNLMAAQVLFGLTPANILEATDDTLTVAAPAQGAGQVEIVVTNRDGNFAVATGSFQYYL